MEKLLGYDLILIEPNYLLEQHSISRRYELSVRLPPDVAVASFLSFPSVLDSGEDIGKRGENLVGFRIIATGNEWTVNLLAIGDFKLNFDLESVM